MSESILEEAQRIINGRRAKDYGDARENHQRIADLWNSYLQLPGLDDKFLTPEDVAVMMILLKIARFMENGYHRDTVTDIAGYAGVLEKMQLPEGERYEEPSPRVWESLYDVPINVKVTDKSDDVWEWRRQIGPGLGKWGFSREGSSWNAGNYGSSEELHSWDHFAPFTEILEGSE